MVPTPAEVLALDEEVVVVDDKGGPTTSEEEEAVPVVSAEAVRNSYANVVHGDNPRKKDDGEAFVAFKFAVTYRKASCACLGLTNLLWLVLTIALALGGFNPINDDSLGEVGLYVLDSPYQLRANAYETAKDEADASLSPGKCAREDPSDPIVLTVMKGRFDKEGRGNALSRRGLELLRSRERKIASEDGWEHRCAGVYAEAYPTCELDRGTPIPAVFGGNATTYHAADEDGCMVPFSPVYLFEKYGDPDFADIAGTVAKIKTDETDWLSFTDMLHKDFTESNLRSKILKSSIYAGTPRHPTSRYVSAEQLERINKGYSISFYNTKEEERELEHLGNWIERNLKNWLDKQVDKTPFRTLYTYPEYEPIQDQVTADLGLLVFALLLVVVYMGLYTGSAFVTACGIFQILMSFFGANLLYRYCWPTATGLGYNFFTLFCALSLFIIMGIGADDIFVYWDTWNGSASHPYPTVAHRMSHVYSHAAVAMCVTSATTVLAFLSNLSSPFIGIKTFGIFSALLVTVNYLAVITFFPTVVLVYDKHLAHRTYWCAPCVARLRRAYRRRRAKAPDTDDVETTSDDVETTSDDAAEQAAAGAPPPRFVEPPEEQHEKQPSAAAAVAEEDALPKFFRTHYADFLDRRRWFVLGALVGLWVVFLAFATMLETTPFKEYELLPETSNFHQYTFVSENWFPKSADPLNVHVVYGLDHRDPLSLNGVRPQNFETLETGDPEFDESFDLDAVSAQLQLIRTAEEFAYAPRRGLKIDSRFGINQQLAGSKTGLLRDTPNGGATSNVQTAYGVQSLFHAVAQWENVSRVVSTETGAYEVRDAFPSSCKPCFADFLIEPNPFSLEQPGWIDPDTGAVVDTITLNSTASLTAGCDCVGFFPIPNKICLGETQSLPDDTAYKCTLGSDQLAFQLESFFESGDDSYDQDWWDDYLFALSDNFGRYTRLAMIDVQVQTTLRSTEKDITLGLRMAKKWEDWMDDHNSDSRNSLKAMVYIPNAENWYRDSLLVPSGISNMVLSLFLAWLVLTFATFNYAVSSLATLTIGMICTCVLGFIHILGWGLGSLESILIVIVVGFSVDYTVHLADSYMNSKAITREGKVRDALGHTGSSVLSGAISTLSASIPMFGAQIIFFFKFGVFVFLTIALSLVYSLGFFATLMMILGPLGTQGHLANLYGSCILSMHETMDELEAEQRAIDEAKSVRKNDKPLAVATDNEEKETNDDDVTGAIA